MTPFVSAADRKAEEIEAEIETAHAREKELLDELEVPLDAAVLMDVDFDILMKRLTGRRTCSLTGSATARGTWAVTTRGT